MNKNIDWYKEQISGLILIMKDSDGMVARDYVEEKLYMILSEQGINFHPLIKQQLEEMRRHNGKEI